MMLVIFSLAVTTVLGDLTTMVVDRILSDARESMNETFPFPPLNWYYATCNKETMEENKKKIEIEFKSTDARLMLGNFISNQTVLDVDSDLLNGTLECEFFVDSTITYNRFTTTNFTSGEQSAGSMSVSYSFTTISMTISIDRTGNDCKTTVVTFEPGSSARARPVLDTTTHSLDLAQRLFFDIEPVIRGNLLDNIAGIGHKVFTDLLKSRNELCTLLDKSSIESE